jgi:hypothetical protein
MAIDVLSYLEANPKISFDDLKAAYPNYDVGKLRKTYDGFQNTLRTTSNTTNPKGGSGGGSQTSWFNPIKKIGEIGQAALETQEQSGYMPDLGEEAIKASSAFKKLMDNVGSLKNPLLIIDNVMNELGNQADLYLTQQTELLGKINKGAGLTGDLSRDIREELTEANPALLRIGIGFDQLANSAEKLVSNSGRFLTLNRDSWLEAGKAATAYVGTLSELVDMMPAFEKIGIGAGNVAENIDAVGKRSLTLGLQSKKTIADLNSNLSKLNEYGFKTGINGLSEMARKATEFRLTMESTFTIAEKVMNPEGAIDMAANLQAIGGAIGDFNDPMKLMYMATNNVEGLQDALIGVTGSLATYNKEQGRFEITGINLRKARALASELGVGYGELANGAIAAAERSSAATTLMARGLDLDEDTKRFITNISTMKDGKMSIALNSDKLKEAFGTNQIDLENLSQANVEKLKQYQDDFKKLTTDEIIQKQATSVENIMRDVNFLAATARLKVAKAGGGALDEVKKFLGYSEGDLEKLSKNVADRVANVNNEKSKTSRDRKTTEQKAFIDNMKTGGVDNSNSNANKNPVGYLVEPKNSTNVNLTVKADVPMDRVTNALVNNTDFAYNFMNAFNTPGSYTQIPYANT